MIPQELREEYQTSEQALRARSRTQSELSRRRIQQGMDKEHRANIEKAEFSDPHKQHISEAASQGLERYREANKAAQTAD